MTISRHCSPFVSMFSDSNAASNSSSRFSNIDNRPSSASAVRSAPSISLNIDAMSSIDCALFELDVSGMVVARNQNVRRV